MYQLIFIVLFTLPLYEAINVSNDNKYSIRYARTLQEVVSINERMLHQLERIYHQGDLNETREEMLVDHSQHKSTSWIEEKMRTETAIDHSLEQVDERLQQYQPPEEAMSDIHDPDESAQDIAKQSIIRSSAVDIERQDRMYASASRTEPTSAKNLAWIAHGTLAVLSFGILMPASIYSALCRDIFPTSWIYIHVFINVATFVLVTVTVGLAFTTMNSQSDKNGHFKELHHIMGLGLLLLVSFQTCNGFLRPHREFITEDEDDTLPGTIPSSDWERIKFTSRTLWYLIHRITSVVIFGCGTWQITSGIAIYARKYNGTDWGSIYLGYVGFLVFVIGATKRWIVHKDKKKEENDKWNTVIELFDTDPHLYN